MHCIYFLQYHLYSLPIYCNIHRPIGPMQNSSDGTVIYLGQANSYEDCKNMVIPIADKMGFGAFTYEDSTSGTYSNVCYGIKGSHYQSNTQSGSFTGVYVNIHKCDLSSANLADISGLRVNGTRAIRARYPNGNSEVYPCGFCSSMNAKGWLEPICKPEPTMEYNPDEPYRDDSTQDFFQKYQLGVGGCCDGFTPNAGYWCGNHTQGGGAFTYRSLVRKYIYFDENMIV